jgi:YHS domain-containing protein
MRKLFKATIGTSCILFLAACGSSATEQKAATATTDTTLSVLNATEKTYDVKLVDNKKDPTCGMPVTAGISDTAHYEHKVLGFCSTECKLEFLKNPKANIAAAELK